MSLAIAKGTQGKVKVKTAAVVEDLGIDRGRNAGSFRKRAKRRTLAGANKIFKIKRITKIVKLQKK